MFAISWQMTKPLVSHLTWLKFVLCRPPYLPSTNDGKGSLPSTLFAICQRRQRVFAVCCEKADDKSAIYSSLLCQTGFPPAANDKGVCRHLFVPFPSAMADDKAADSCSGERQTPAKPLYAIQVTCQTMEPVSCVWTSKVGPSRFIPQYH